MKTKRKKGKWYISKLNDRESVVSKHGKVVAIMQSKEVHQGLVFKYIPLPRVQKNCVGCAAEHSTALCMVLPDCDPQRGTIIWKRVHSKKMLMLVGGNVLFTQKDVDEMEQEQCNWGLA